jgi:hypothetical protein
VEEEEDLKEWIRDSLEDGHSPSEVRHSLESAGLDPDTVETVLEEDGADNEQEEEEEEEERADQDSDLHHRAHIAGIKDRFDTELEKTRAVERRVARRWKLVGGALLLIAAGLTPVIVPELSSDGGTTVQEPVATDQRDTTRTASQRERETDRALASKVVNITQSGIKPLNPSLQAQAISFSNQVKTPVNVSLSGTGRTRTVEPSGHATLTVEESTYFTVSQPRGSTTGSIQKE